MQKEEIAKLESLRDEITGDLDINQVDLSKFTKEAKIKRKRDIEVIRLRLAKTSKGYPIGIDLSILSSLELCMRVDHDLKLLEKAFMEELGIDLEKNAEELIAEN